VSRAHANAPTGWWHTIEQLTIAQLTWLTWLTQSCVQSAVWRENVLYRVRQKINAVNFLHKTVYCNNPTIRPSHAATGCSDDRPMYTLCNERLNFDVLGERN